MTGVYRIGVVAVVLAGGAAAQPVSAPDGTGASIIGLGDLPGGTVSSVATAVSADGLTVVGSSFSGFIDGDEEQPEAFVWTLATGMLGLGDLPGGTDRSWGYAVSANGAVVVGQSVRADVNGEARGVPMRWTLGDSMSEIVVFEGVLDGAGSTPGGAALGVSGDGATVIGEGIRGADRDERQAFVLTEGVGTSWIDSGPFGFNTPSTAEAVSSDGSVVVGEIWEFPVRAFVWRGGEIVFEFSSPLAFFPAVSGDGRVALGYGLLGFELRAFRWIEGRGVLPLPDAADGDWMATATAINHNGTVVLGDSNSGVQYLWTPVGGIRPVIEVLEEDHGLDLTGWDRLYLTDLSADGRVLVGSGERPGGEVEAVRIELPWVCRADFSHDGFIDLGDLQAFVEALLGRDPQADLNGDGVLDHGDIYRFVEHFLGQC